MGSRLKCLLAAVFVVLLLCGTLSAQSSQPITVYFTYSAPDSFYLMPVSIPLEGDPTPEQALQWLIQGPPTGSALSRNVPADTEVLDFWIDGGVAHVDFSDDVLAASLGSAAEGLLIGAVTNTLGGFPTIDEVQFLVEGEVVESLGGHFDAREPFLPQWDMVIQDPFSDVEGHWAQGKINSFFLTGMVEGYGDETFRPQRSITRAEFVKLLVLTVTGDLVSPAEPTFTDTGDAHWAYSFVETAVERGILVPEDYGTQLAPETPLSRREMAVLLTRANDLESRAGELVDAELPYTDVAELPPWARGFVAAVTEVGLMQGDAEGSFRPDSTATRAEATAVLTRQLGTGEEDVCMVWPACGHQAGDWVLLGGVARTFEGTVNARLLDAGAQVHAQTFTTATQGGPGWGFWAVMLPVPVSDEDVEVQAFSTSAKDGEEENVVTRTLTTS